MISRTILVRSIMALSSRLLFRLLEFFKLGLYRSSYINRNPSQPPRFHCPILSDIIYEVTRFLGLISWNAHFYNLSNVRIFLWALCLKALSARNGPVYAGIPYRDFFFLWISYRHLSIYVWAGVAQSV
jgi:hypothetical protein